MRLWLEPSPDAHLVRVILSCLLVKKNYLFSFGCTRSSLLCGLFSSCSERGYSVAVMHRFPPPCSLVVEQGLGGTGFSACSL